MYYIVDGVVFQSANLKSIFIEKLERASFWLKNAFEALHDNHHMVDKNPWKTESSAQNEIDYDELFEDVNSEKTNIMVNNAMKSIFD